MGVGSCLFIVRIWGPDDLQTVVSIRHMLEKRLKLYDAICPRWATDRVEGTCHSSQMDDVKRIVRRLSRGKLRFKWEIF